MTAASGVPRVEWKMLLWYRSLRVGDGPLSTYPTLRDAVAGSSKGAAAHLLIDDGDGWTVQAYESPLPLVRSALHDLSVVGLASRALLIDGHGAIGVLAPAPRAIPIATRISIADLALDKGSPGLLAAAHFVDLMRAIEGEPRLPLVPVERLENHGENEAWKPEIAFAPDTTIDQLVDVMLFLKNATAGTGTRLHVKAGGSRHSWSRAAASEQVYIYPQRMNFVRALQDDSKELQVLRTGGGGRLEDLFIIGSGTKISEINDSLWSRGKALPLLGGYDGQTLAGVVQTGTHGSVLKHGPIAEIVESINLVDAQGARTRIEPADGPTDPQAFAAEFPEWTLRQDTDLFDAAVISVGAFGVVHSYRVRVIDAFYLSEMRTEMKLSELQPLLRGGNIYRLLDTAPPDSLPVDDGRRLRDHPGNVFHLEFLVNPHETRGDHTVIVTSRAIVPARVPEPWEISRPRSDSRYLLRVLTQRTKFSRPALSTWITENVPRFLNVLPVAVGRFLPKDVPELLDLGMRNLVDKAFEGRSYNVFNIGDGPNSIPALSGEPSVPLRDDLYLDALDLILERVKHFQARGMLHTGPLSLRFVAGSSGMLADPEDVCRFEIIFTAHTRHALILIRDYEDRLYERFGGDVRPHWGQINAIRKETRGRLEEMYPRLGEWKRQRAQFDPDAVFLNDWQRDLFLWSRRDHGLGTSESEPREPPSGPGRGDG